MHSQILVALVTLHIALLVEWRKTIPVDTVWNCVTSDLWLHPSAPCATPGLPPCHILSQIPTTPDPDPVALPFPLWMILLETSVGGDGSFSLNRLHSRRTKREVLTMCALVFQSCPWVCASIFHWLAFFSFSLCFFPPLSSLFLFPPFLFSVERTGVVSVQICYGETHHKMQFLFCSCL